MAMKRWRLRPAEDLDLPFGERLRSLRRESGFVSTLWRVLWWLVVRGYLHGYHRLTVVGREHLPKTGPFVLVANHSSHLDAITLSAGLPMGFCDRTHALAAGDTFFTSLSSSVFAATALNALPIQRGKTRRHELARLRERLQAQACVYLIFPEGTRSRDGTMADFKPGLGTLVAGSTVPVVPCRIAGAHRALPPQARVPRPRALHLSIGAPLEFPETSNDMAGWREIATALETAVRSLPSRP